MSHPDPKHDRNNEYPSDNYKPVAKKKKGKAKHTAISAMIDSLKERKGESPLSKLKRLTK